MVVLAPERPSSKTGLLIGEALALVRGVHYAARKTMEVLAPETNPYSKAGLLTGEALALVIGVHYAARRTVEVLEPERP
ncbi:hypothetical protein NDU88_008238 [Pleurodeles waltl]|uniref:Uncharacterized protein n=1 Tax=Pleurodeles waltl TaxID=8319 RepID=A0AAV7U2P4_PLEWA|nr:hypothetical protein NDU88_008238 [Pleurodeles waltl]